MSIFRVFAGTLLVVGGLVSSGARAQCLLPSPALRNPTVRFEVQEPHLVYRTDLDLVGLSVFSQTFESAPKGWVVLGLTNRNDVVSLNVRGVRTPSADGRTCYWVGGVDMRVGGPDMDVYVAANYKPGSCEYNTVAAHEGQHVSINTTVLHQYAPQLAAALRSATRQRFPIVSSDPATENQLANILMGDVQPVYDRMVADLRAQNGAIDTPENYRRTAALCHNWFPSGTRMPDGTTAGLRGK